MAQQPDVIALAEQFREALLRQDAAQLGRLARAYADIAKRLGTKIELLIREIGDLDNPTNGQIARMDRYVSLLEDTNRELTQFQGFASVEIQQNARRVIGQGSIDATRLAAVQLGDAQLAAGFNSLPTDAIETLLGFLQPDGPLYQRLTQLAPITAGRIGDALLEGVALGYNPTKVASYVNNALGMGLTDAMRMARTANLYAYREASRATYVANPDIVEGWIWYAELDGACPSCVAMHGSFHTNDETLNDHHNGRCAAIPKVIGRDTPVTQSGEDWLKEQPESTQRQVLGPGKYDAWRSGTPLDSFTDVHDDPVYGPMRVEAPLS